MRGLAAAIFLILLAITTTDARAATGAAQAYCAKPVPTLASICSGIAAAKPEAFEALAGLLEHAGRYAQGAAVETQAVALQQKAGAPAVAALARDLAALSRLDILAGDYPAAEKAAVQAVATAPSADPAAQSAALLAAGIADRAMGHYDLGAPKLRNALALRVTALGPDAPGTADVLDALADLLGNAGALAEAQADALKAVQIRVKSGGKTSADFAHSAVILALILRAGGHYADAEQLALQAQQAARQSLGADHPEYAKALNVLGIVYRAEGRIADAEYVTNIALGVQIKAFGKATPDIATTANNLALIYEQEGKLAKAEPLFRQVLQIRIETLGADHPDVGNTYDNLAGLMRRLGRLDEAEQDYEQAIAIQAAALGPDHPDVAEDLANLAYVLRMEGQFDQAEALLRRALSIRIRALPPGHPDIAATEVSLGDVLQAEGRSNDAEAAYLQALAIQEKSLGMHHAAVAITLNDLAALYRTANRIPEAVADYTKALEIQRAVLPPGDPDIAITLGNIADVLAFEGRFDEADRMQQQALKIRVDTLGPRHPLVATSLGNLAKLRRLQHKLGEAEKLQRQVVDIRLAAYGPDNPDVAQDYSDLAEILSDEGHTKPALEAMRKATAIYRARNAGADEQTPADADAERKAARFVFVNHVYLLEVAMHKLPRQSQALLAESFEVAQLAQNWSVGAVVQQMAARFATGTSDLARLVRQQQDTLDQVAKVDSLLDQLALLPPEKQDPSALDALRNQRSKLDDSLNDLATVIQQRFPEYAAATSLQPVTLKQIQHLLHPEEALVSYLLGGDSTFIWIVRPHSAALVKAPIGQQQILAMVRQLRAGLDPAVYALTGRMPIYDTTLAYQFYKSILAPARAKIGSATRLLIVADGPLQALPMNVLVLSPPKRPKPGAAPDYRKVDWLIRHYASAMLPSTSSLRALRSFARAPAAGQPFLGIGDPDLGEPLRRSSVRKLKTGVDVRLVNRLVPLPETANELRQIAGILKAPAANVIITQAATISRVRSLDLSQYRVVAFATHGLITGELRGLTEPAIVLTPDPEHGDNGLLRASEIAQLHFNADWVVLSACNTAASDGTIGAEGFSGLAKAFFYAGTRALVVSNWPVNSAASVQLTTNSVGMAASKHRVGKADALQHSMLQLLTKGNPFFAHPMMWAPFVIVGEGGPSAS